MGKIKRTVPNVSWCWLILSIRAQCPIQVRQLLPRGLLYLTSCFHLFWKNILSAMYVDWGPPHFNLVVCYVFHLLTPLLCKTWFWTWCRLRWPEQDLSQRNKPSPNPVLNYYYLGCLYENVQSSPTSQQSSCIHGLTCVYRHICKNYHGLIDALSCYTFYFGAWKNVKSSGTSRYSSTHLTAVTFTLEWCLVWLINIIPP